MYFEFGVWLIRKKDNFHSILHCAMKTKFLITHDTAFTWIQRNNLMRHLQQNCSCSVLYQRGLYHNDITDIKWKQNGVINSSSLCLWFIAGCLWFMTGYDWLISRHTAVSWPSWSLDRTPVDFWFWGNRKYKVNTPGKWDVSKLKHIIKREVI